MRAAKRGVGGACGEVLHQQLYDDIISWDPKGGRGVAGGGGKGEVKRKFQCREGLLARWGRTNPLRRRREERSLKLARKAMKRLTRSQGASSVDVAGR